MIPIPKTEIMALWRRMLDLAEPFGFLQDHYYWIDTCIDAVVEESLAVGAVSFEHSQLAKQFAKLRNGMHKEVYPFSNSPEEKQLIREVINFLSTRVANPHLVAALMVDHQAQTLVRMIKGEIVPGLQWGEDADELLLNLTVFDYGRLSQDIGNINILTPNFDWALERIGSRAS
jgi:hypothetical protein